MDPSNRVAFLGIVSREGKLNLLRSCRSQHISDSRWVGTRKAETAQGSFGDIIVNAIDTESLAAQNARRLLESVRRHPVTFPSLIPHNLIRPTPGFLVGSGIH
ncbi:hypothetical protein PAAG_04975 [Paracoccidioides lutzii Pb01]|uniref:Uncharacterized protein n=1 Tax=Paracoccidioides lutzii (strain ATCC MYA-826 / Pb01) TaxID=502779 RepID=C1H2I2_PARBA|nr:hypothetical protein PAAG_04975 [Paracoccidioides lutzii Pb01]EEH33926.2 hypothetical protein PAAG_04975 [Paracoccidioides lutzii Pb01]